MTNANPEYISEPYPLDFNLCDISEFIWRGSDHGHVTTIVKDNKNRSYRILCSAMMELLKVGSRSVPVVYKYNNYYLDFQLTKRVKKQRRLKDNEEICKSCNGHGMIIYRHCNSCNGSGKIKKIL